MHPYYEKPYNGEKVYLRVQNGCAYLDDYDLCRYPVVPGKIIVGSSGAPPEVVNPDGGITQISNKAHRLRRLAGWCRLRKVKQLVATLLRSKS